MKCPSLSFLITFGWKLIWFDIRMATSACFGGLFAWNIVFQPSTLRQCLSLCLRCVSCIQQNAGSCLYVQSVSLCLFIGEWSPLMLRDIKKKWLLLPVIFVVRGRIMFVWLSPFGFVERLPYWFFYSAVSCIVLVFFTHYPLQTWIFERYCVNLVLSWNILFLHLW